MASNGDGDFAKEHPQPQHPEMTTNNTQQIFVVTTNDGGGDEGDEGVHSPHIRVLQQETITIEEGEGISAGETSDAVASVLPDQAEDEIMTTEEIVTETVEEDHSFVVNGSDSVVSEHQIVTIVEEGDTQHLAAQAGIGGDFFVQDASEVNGGDVIQLKEEEIIETPSSETEMSVAMEMAKLSQGIGGGNFSNGDSSGIDVADLKTTVVGDLGVTVGGGSEVVTAEKPKLSYAQMIAEALMATEERMLPLAEIYAAINKRHPFYRMDVKSWQNAIRHNLTLNPAFTKVPRPTNEGRGNFWRMEDGAERTIFRRQIRAAQQQKQQQQQQRAKQLQQQQRQQQQQQHRQLQQQQQPLVTTVVRQEPTAPQSTTPRFIIQSTGSSSGSGAVITKPPIIQLVKGVAVNGQQSVSVTTTPSATPSFSSSPSATQQQQQQKPQSVSAVSTGGGGGTRVMRIKETIVRQNGSVVFIAMPSEEKVAETVVEYTQ